MTLCSQVAETYDCGKDTTASLRSLPWCHCGGLNENVPLRLKSLNIQSLGGGALWRSMQHCWRKDVTGVGLWEFIALLDLHYILSACVWVWRHHCPDSHLGCRVCCSLSCLPTIMLSDPSGTQPRLRSFFPGWLLVTVLYQCNSKNQPHGHG